MLGRTFCFLVSSRNLFVKCASSQNKLTSMPVTVSSCRFKGHSHWQNIKSTKMKIDQMKSKVTQKYVKKVQKAVKYGGPDLATNRGLQRIFEMATEENVSLSSLHKTIHNQISKPVETGFYDVRGPGESCIIVECLTPTVKQTLVTLKYRAKRVPFPFDFDTNVRSYFTHVGYVWVRKYSTPEVNEEEERKKSKSWNAPQPKQYPPPLTLDEAESLAIEVNAESVTEITDDDDKEAFEILCDPDHPKRIENELLAKNYIVTKAESEFRPFQRVKLTKEQHALVQQFYQVIEDYIDEVENVYDNIEEMS